MTTTGERRADAERNVAAILDAAVDLLADDPGASMAEVARRAGVVRATLYAHFPSRAELLEAVVTRALGQAQSEMDAARPQDGPAGEALARLVAATWPVINRHRRIAEAVAGTMGNADLQRRHAPIVDRMRELIRRGQKDGVFRADLSADWLAACVIGLMHTGRDEVNEGRMTAAEASEALVSTVLALLSSNDR